MSSAFRCNNHSTNHLLQSLPAAEFEALRPHLQFVELVQETVLVEAGAPVTHVYLPQSAVLSITVRVSEGPSVEVALLGRDTIFGAAATLHDGISLTDAVVRLPGTAAILDVGYFLQAADRSVIVRTLLARHERSLIAKSQQSVACNVAHSIEARLSRWLLRARDLTDSENLPLTQDCMAQMLGGATQRGFAGCQFVAERWYYPLQPGTNPIREVARLRETSCECYRAVKAQHDRLLKASA